MFLQHFGLSHAPLSKQVEQLWDDGDYSELREPPTRFFYTSLSPQPFIKVISPGLTTEKLLVPTDYLPYCSFHR